MTQTTVDDAYNEICDLKDDYQNELDEIVTSLQELIDEAEGESSEFANAARTATLGRINTLWQELWRQIDDPSRNGTSANHPNAAATFDANKQLIAITWPKIKFIDDGSQSAIACAYNIDDSRSLLTRILKSYSAAQQACAAQKSACDKALSSWQQAIDDEEVEPEGRNSYGASFVTAYIRLAEALYDASANLPTGIKVTTPPTIAEMYYDIDGDGKLDILSSANSRGRAEICNFQSDGTWKGFATTSFLKSGNDHHRFVNIDNDGNIDILSLDSKRKTDKVWRGTATHDFEQIKQGEFAGVYVADCNNDGAPDLLQPDSRQLFSFNHNRELTAEWFDVTDPASYMARPFRPTGGGIQMSAEKALSLSIMAPTSWLNNKLFSTDDFITIDLNGDALPDLVDGATGRSYINLGEGTFAANELGGSVKLRDLNGDGLIDYVVFDTEAQTITAYILQSDGKLSDGQTLVSGLKIGKEIWYYDFNHDGHVDILIPLNYYDNEASYLMLMENRGDGTFVKHEAYIAEPCNFQTCLDIDADGCYEVLAYHMVGAEADEWESTNLVSYRINGTTIGTTATTLLKGVEFASYNSSNYRPLIADYDGTGIMRTYVTQKDAYGKANTAMLTLGNKKNNAPKAPAQPTYIYDDATGLLKISWLPTTDAESSPADLTYELRIGTTRDGGEVLYAHALPDGTRRNLLDGNQGYSLQRIIDTKSWTSGTYYISVQAIDPNHAGSAFSPCTVFNKSAVSTAFAISHGKQLGMGDEVTVTLRNTPEKGCTYDWDFADATVTAKADNGMWHKLTFPTAGTKVIRLNVSGAGSGQSARALQVSSVNVKESPLNLPEDADMLTLAVDIDMDGRSELFCNDLSYPSYMIEWSKDSTYTKIRRTWNTNLIGGGKPVVCDINRDGLPDIFMPGMRNMARNVNMTLLINNGNKDFSVQTPSTPSISNNGVSVDLNNDGVQEYISDWGVFTPTDSYHTFTELSLTGAPDLSKSWRYVLFRDFNGDGLVDILSQDNTIYYNQGDYTFTQGENILEARADSYRTLYREDLDNDSKFDFLVNYKGEDGNSHYAIWWGDGTTTQIDDFVKIDGCYCMDLDNNGLIDIAVSAQLKGTSSSNSYAITFLPGHKYDVSWLANNGFYLNCIFYDANRQLHTEGYVIKAANSKPQPPTGLRSTQTVEGVTLSWNHSADAETPAIRMRYNLSIKHKGKNGEGAYLFSPLNGEKNDVPIATDQQLVGGNTFFIPTASITTGEYEVRIQGIDLWDCPSDFSDTYHMTVQDSKVVGITSPSAGIGISGNRAQQCIDISTPVAARATVHTAAGTQVHDAMMPAGQHTISCATWQSGIYIVTVSSATGTRSVKVAL